MYGRTLSWRRVGSILLTSAGCGYCSFRCISSNCWAYYSDVMVLLGFKKLYWVRPAAHHQTVTTTFFWYKFGFGKCFGASFWSNHWLVIANCMKMKSESEVAQSCPTLCDPMDCSLPGFSIHGIFQGRVLDLVAFSFSRGSSQPRDRTQVSHIVGRCFTLWATREAHYFLSHVTVWLRNCLFLLHSIRKTLKTMLFFFFSFS